MTNDIDKDIGKDKDKDKEQALLQDDYIHISDLNLYSSYIVFVPRARIYDILVLDIFFMYVDILCV